MRPLSRRAFVALAAAFAAPQWALGQTARRIYRLAWLATIDGSKEPYSLALVQRRRELGFADGNNLQITSRHAGGRIERLPSLAAELVKLNPDLLFGSGVEANLVALTQAGGDIPIVFIAVDFDPIATGHVVNPARPGGRLTGLTAVQSVLPGKRLELVKELLPATRKVAVLGNDETVGQLAVTEEAPNGWRWSCTSFSSSALHSTTKPRLEKRCRRARKSSSYSDPRSSCRRDDSFPSSPSRPACRVCSTTPSGRGSAD
jgi:putative tryptophan/tyrosine transport system substrate-binding protein